MNDKYQKLRLEEKYIKFKKMRDGYLNHNRKVPERIEEFLNHYENGNTNHKRKELFERD